MLDGTSVDVGGVNRELGTSNLPVVQLSPVFSSPKQGVNLESVSFTRSSNL